VAGLVELGGEVRALGRRTDGQPWRVAIVHPRAPERTMAVVELDGNAVSTSGDYEKYFLVAGGALPAEADSRLAPAARKRRASHILDPRTGRPLIGGAVSVTVIAPECILADGLATAISVLGPAEGLKLVESYRAAGQTVEALIVEEQPDGKLVPHLSPGLKGLEVKL
jgi:thiamine biosynthesis lipoprotein